MSAIINGITLLGGLAHDSIGLGEDGPNHQVIEQIPTLRMIPNMNVWRACDAVELAVAWKKAIESKSSPSCLIFSRQSLPHVNRNSSAIKNIGKGGYILKDTQGAPDAIIATGPEVQLAAEISSKEIRVVSMPSTTQFDLQDESYRDFVLPKSIVARIAIEAGIKDG